VCICVCERTRGKFVVTRVRCVRVCRKVCVSVRVYVQVCVCVYEKYV
jgi:hypothetical protein